MTSDHSAQPKSFAMPHPTRSPLVLHVPDIQPPLELLGEIDDWLTPRPVAPGKLLTIPLPPGVYAYKYRQGNHWLLDPHNPRTRTTHNTQNNIAVLGGTPEPILFAPAPPFLVAHQSGQLVVRAALRQGHGSSLVLRWNDSTPHLTTMTTVAVEQEHHLLETVVPLSTAPIHLSFQLQDGRPIGADDQATPFVVDPSAFPRLPTWWTDAVVYTIFVDRFRADPDAPDLTDPGRNRAAGGTLDGIRASLPCLCDLGINTLYLTPIHVAANCHRYDLIDPMRADPALGGDEAFRRLLKDAHERQMRVLLDFSFSHVGRGFPPFEDVLEKGSTSPFAPWFQWKLGEPASLQHYGRRSDAPRLDLNHPDVRELVLSTARYWASFEIDGFRLDAAAEVPHDLAREVRKNLLESRPSALVLGEVVPAHAWRWHMEQSVDVSTDFGFHEAVLAFVANRGIDAPEFSRHLERVERARGVTMEGTARFLSTHDHNRFATFARMQGDPGRHSLGMLLLLSFPGTPMLLYGEELGLSSEIAEIDPESVWLDRMPMRWEHRTSEAAIRDLTQALLRTRHAHAALRTGSLAIAHAQGPLFIFRRQEDGEAIDVAVNASDLPVEVDLEDDDLDVIQPLVVVGEVQVSGSTVVLGPNGGVVALRRGGPRALAIRASRITANEGRLDKSFESLDGTIACRPKRIDLTVTERCNLRCAHCINHSPERTRSSRARVFSRFLLERLREDLGYASYFGFVHGGESLTAPIFWDVLAAIRSTRPATLETTIHLLSNGMMLTDPVVHRLIDLGVNSLAVSIDGATASTNDRIRVGGSLRQIESNVRSAVALRKSLVADLRLGLSFVVLRDNLKELSRFVEMARDWGVDWVKLEELVTVNEASRGWLLDLSSNEPREEIGAAMDRARELGLVAVDHTVDRELWRCGLDEAALRFVEADEFANRSKIHPCRAPWDRACIEPNGDVRLGDVHGSIVGNLSNEDLSEIWSGAVARAERHRIRSSWKCAPGPMTCCQGATSRG